MLHAYRYVSREVPMSKITRPALRVAAVLVLSLGLPLATLAAPQAGPQQEDSGGRTELPMRVSESIHFREIGPAISGGRVSAVAGVAGNPAVYYVGAADGGYLPDRGRRHDLEGALPASAGRLHRRARDRSAQPGGDLGGYRREQRPQ